MTLKSKGKEKILINEKFETKELLKRPSIELQEQNKQRRARGNSLLASLLNNLQ